MIQDLEAAGFGQETFFVDIWDGFHLGPPNRRR